MTDDATRARLGWGRSNISNSVVGNTLRSVCDITRDGKATGIVELVETTLPSHHRTLHQLIAENGDTFDVGASNRAELHAWLAAHYRGTK